MAEQHSPPAEQHSPPAPRLSPPAEQHSPPAPRLSPPAGPLSPPAGRLSPLAGAAGRLAGVTAASAGALVIAEVPFLTQLDLRLAPDGPAATAVAKELGAALPLQPCTSTRSGEIDILWLGPDEWLIIAPPGLAAPLSAQLRTATAAEHASVVDVSAQRTTVQLSGPRTRDLLAHGCAIDLHPSAFATGACVQTALAQTPIIVHRRDPAFRLLVRSSLAAHLADWLLDAGVEYTA